MATASETTRGFALRCPHCGTEDALRIDVGDVHSLSCTGCDDEVTADELRGVIEGYGRLLAWLDTAPAKD